MRLTPLAILGTAITLAACAVGPDYRRPPVAVPEAFRAAAAPADGPSFGDQSWTDVYTDPALRELVAAALRGNPDLLAAVARVDQARAILGETRLALLPTVDVQAGVSRSKSSADVLLPGAARLRNSEEVAGTLAFEVDLWGRLRRATEAARATLLSTDYARRTVQSALVASVASGYFTLVSLDAQLEITRRTVGTREKFVELTRAQHERGYATGLDVATAESQAAVARANVPDLERRIAQTEDLLCGLIGDMPHPIARQHRGEGMPELPPAPPPGIPSQLLERRPDVRQAEEALHAANANVGVAKAALFPRISLTGLMGSLSSPLGSLFRAPTAEWSAAASAVQPLLDPQRSLYQVELADARKREALHQYEKAVQDAFREVADALVAYAKFGEFSLEQAKQVAALRRAEEIALARYRVGYASYFDVINADRDLFAAELALNQARANDLIALVQLYQALGGGWE
ncbi:MAG: efflux transporter outer membrane subunit [Proteobacteria bacterium]|nr:efflux transporter outer membrane subunit [Pseudomonadota bacterium]